MFAIIKPIKGGVALGKSSAAAEAHHAVSPYAKELGKLLFEGKMGAAKRLCEMRARVRGDIGQCTRRCLRHTQIAAEEEAARLATPSTVKGYTLSLFCYCLSHEPTL